MILESTIYGFIGMAALLAVYFSVVSLISGWLFALSFGFLWSSVYEHIKWHKIKITAI